MEHMWGNTAAKGSHIGLYYKQFNFQFYFSTLFFNSVIKFLSLMGC